MKSIDSISEIDALRHSAAHLLAAAVLKHYPKALPTIGPSIDNGFYYDFDFGDTVISQKDLSKIEKEMHRLVKNWLQFDRHEVSLNEALTEFAHNSYKSELIEEFSSEGQTLSVYESGSFRDLCRGGHVDSPAQSLKYFKLLSVAGAYWRGSEKNKMLTRIYGTAFFSQQELDDHLLMLEEAKKRDHRVLGAQLDLFFIDDMIGKGLINWLPKGNVIKSQIEQFAIQEEAKVGYVRVTTPHIARKELFETSGHLPYYKDSMFPAMEMDDGTYYLKAMNCPSHHRIFLHKPRSYRELPLRLAEYGTCYRNELSGTLQGLLRVRGMAMNDAHIYCTKDQIKSEFEGVVKLTQNYFRVFGLKKYWFRLSKWDPNHTEKYINEPENWELSQEILREVLTDLKVEFIERDDEAAFYGPKVDVQFSSAVGREETMSTIQLDFVAKNRFNLSYTDQNGQENHDVYVIHRAPLSVHERFLAFLIEHFAGSFPLWLAPVQAVIIPINETHLEYANQVLALLTNAGIRTEVWSENHSMQKKIRVAEKQKIPYMLVVGDKESVSDQVSVRTRGQVDLGGLPVSQFIDQATQLVNSKSLSLDE